MGCASGSRILHSPMAAFAIRGLLLWVALDKSRPLLVTATSDRNWAPRGNLTINIGFGTARPAADKLSHG
jgi:hypothetical protein